MTELRRLIALELLNLAVWIEPAPYKLRLAQAIHDWMVRDIAEEGL